MNKSHKPANELVKIYCLALAVEFIDMLMSKEHGTMHMAAILHSFECILGFRISNTEKKSLYFLFQEQSSVLERLRYRINIFIM